VDFVYPLVLHAGTILQACERLLEVTFIVKGDSCSDVESLGYDKYDIIVICA
jgi:hypothetical protein